MQLKVTFTNSTLTKVRTQEIEEDIQDRVIHLAGGIDRLFEYYSSPDRKSNPFNRYNLYLEQARREAVEMLGYSPTHRNSMILEVTFRG